MREGWAISRTVPGATAWPPRGGYSEKNWVFSNAPRPVDRTGARGGETDMPWLPYQPPKNPTLGRQCGLVTGWDLAAEGGGAPSRPPRGAPVHGFRDFRPDLSSAFTLNAPPQKHPLIKCNLFQMDQQKEDLVPKASEQYEPPSSKVTGEGAPPCQGLASLPPLQK